MSLVQTVSDMVIQNQQYMDRITELSNQIQKLENDKKESEFILRKFKENCDTDCPVECGCWDRCPNGEVDCPDKGLCWADIYRQEYRAKQNGGSDNA